MARFARAEGRIVAHNVWRQGLLKHLERLLLALVLLARAGRDIVACHGRRQKAGEGSGVVGLVVSSSFRRCASQRCCCGVQSSNVTSAWGAAENRARVFPVEDYGQRTESPC